MTLDETKRTRTDHLVDTEWLEKHREDPALRVVEVVRGWRKVAPGPPT
jgi:hypothetical protein